MRVLIVGLTAIVFLAAAPTKQTFTGRITDSMCARGDHSGMKMGETDAECTTACVRAHGALYVLWDGTRSYEFENQTIPERFAGMKVKVTGSWKKNGKLHATAIKVVK
ncbi:MAG: hypothetical protein ABIR70_12240 [Bryobacteraceae bacterium]